MNPVTKLILIVLFSAISAAGATEVVIKVKPTVPDWQKKLYKEWKELPVPPITPYKGPFGGEVRPFIGKKHGKNFYDFSFTAPKGVYRWQDDPRPINEEYEKAVIEDWRRMGYNCAYKGAFFTWRVGAYIKKKYGMLGAIAQTYWGMRGDRPLDYTGNPVGSRTPEGCGSFFVQKHYDQGVAAVAGQTINYPTALFQVGDHRITSSWDEVGLRTRKYLDYRPQAKVEFRKYLRDIWFQDKSPGEDSNKDGRTYNQFTGEKLTSWNQVELLRLSSYYNDAWRSRDKPAVDRAIWEQPGRFKLLLDFQGYWTIEFFRRINNDATKAINAKGMKGRVSCYPFMQHFIIWPSANATAGNSFYWYSRLSPVVNIEHMWPDAPVMNLNYAITDRLGPRFKTPLMAWIWFYFGSQGAEMYNGPHDIDRAMARMMGHRVDGTHHWLYSPIYRGRDQKQRLQIAYWQNFLATHYKHYFAKSAPPAAQVAMLMPNYTGYFYRYFQYPKTDWAYTAEGFQNAQLNYEMVTEEELELDDDVLNQYKVLYVIGSEWTTPTIKRRIDAFTKQGGIVYANVDSLSLDITKNKRTDYLEKTFGVRIKHKYKTGFFPSAQTQAESAWAKTLDTWNGPVKLQGYAVHYYKDDDPRAFARLWARTPKSVEMDDKGKSKRIKGWHLEIRKPEWKMIRDKDGRLVPDEKVFKQYDALMAKMPKSVRGITQSALDMHTPPIVRVGSVKLPTYSEIDTAEVVRGKPIAWYGKEAVGVETDRTIWMGLRLGEDLHAISPRISMTRMGEVCNPFATELSDNYTTHKPYVDALAYAAKKAGVKRVAELTRGGKRVYNLEVLPRVDAKGTLMVIVINHDATEAKYDVAINADYVKPKMEVWEMLTEKVIETDTDGRFALRVPAWGVSVFVLGTSGNLNPLKKAQAKLNKKDMSVPKYFTDRPELNKREWGPDKIPEIGK